MNLDTLPTIELERIARQPSPEQAQVILQQRRQAEQEQANRLHQQQAAIIAENELTRLLAEFQEKRATVASHLQAWLAEGASLFSELEALNRDAVSIVKTAELWAEAAMKSGLTYAPPAGSFQEQKRAVGEQKLIDTTGSARLMNLIPQPADPVAMALAGALGSCCLSQRRPFGFGYTSANRPTWGLPPGAIE